MLSLYFAGVVSPISLDSDDEDDDTMYKNSKSSAECGATLTRMTVSHNCSLYEIHCCVFQVEFSAKGRCIF